MQITLVWAMTEKGLIGNQNSLPWRLPKELKHFKATTMGKAMVMGRKTFESIGKALPGRQTIVLTHNKNFKAKEVDVAFDVQGVFEAIENREELMVVGGAKIYELFLPLADKLIVSDVEGMFEGDTYFPAMDWDEWVVMKEEKHEGFCVKTYERLHTFR